MLHSSPLNRTAAGLALAGMAGLADAAGFALIEQNASALGNAYAGAAAVAADASTIYFNPAGMTRLPDRQVVVAGQVIRLGTEFSGTVSPAIGGGNGGEAGGWSFLPSGYFAYRLSPRAHLGVGLNSPFGLKTEYAPDWVGRYQAIKSELKTVNVNPSIAYKVSDALSVGAGVDIQWIQAELTNRQPLGPVPAPVTLVRIKGDDYGWGYNLGALWQLTAASRVGLSYRSRVAYRLDGASSTAGPVVAALNGPVTADIALPDSASLSVFHRFSPRWDLLADLTWTGWSSFDQLAVQGTVNKTSPERWRNVLRYSAGATWHASESLSLRGGVAYDEAPVSDRYRTPRIPDGARTWLAVGGQYRLSKQAALDFGYAHLFVSSAEVRSSDNGTTLIGQYDSQVDLVSAQYTHSF